MIKAIKTGKKDNVATVINNVEVGQVINIFNKDGSFYKIKSKAKILFGHKISIKDINIDEFIIKYDTSIGRAKKKIPQGFNVHVNEIQSKYDINKKTRTDKIIKINLPEFKKKISAILKKHIPNKDIKKILLNYLLEAEMKGVKTHGIRRLPLIIERIQNKSINLNPKLKFKWHGSMLIVDADNTLGHYAMIKSIEQIKKKISKKVSITCTIKNSTHFGYAGYYSSKISDLNCISFVSSNGPPLMSPLGYKEAVVSNNPLSISAKINNNKYFEADLATSVTSRSNILNAIKKNQTIDEGLIMNSKGFMTTNVDEAKAGILIPMQNYKGYALALGLELLTGVLSGGPILSDVKHKDRNSRHKEKISHFILAIKNSNHKSITNFISIIEKTKKNKNKKNSWPGMKKYKNFITSNKNNKIELNELDYKNLDRI